jgi:hypothetical protein
MLGFRGTATQVSPRTPSLFVEQPLACEFSELIFGYRMGRFIVWHLLYKWPPFFAESEYYLLRGSIRATRHFTAG